MTFHRAYLATPYDSAPSYDIAIREAMRVALLFDAPVIGYLRPSDPKKPGIWSPVLQGHILSEHAREETGRSWSRAHAIEWCRENLRTGGFDALIYGDRCNGALNSEGMRMEFAEASARGMRVIRESEVSDGI